MSDYDVSATEFDELERKCAAETRRATSAETELREMTAECEAGHARILQLDLRLAEATGLLDRWYEDEDHSEDGTVRSETAAFRSTPTPPPAHERVLTPEQHAGIGAGGGDERDPSLETVSGSFNICSACLDGEGGECHTPGCLLWINRAPDLAIREALKLHGCAVTDRGAPPPAPEPEAKTEPPKDVSPATPESGARLDSDRTKSIDETGAAGSAQASPGSEPRRTVAMPWTPEEFIALSAKRAQQPQSIQSKVRADLVERERLGIERYGAPLMATTPIECVALREAYEEGLDQLCYMRLELDRREAEGETLERIEKIVFAVHLPEGTRNPNAVLQSVRDICRSARGAR